MTAETSVLLDGYRLRIFSRPGDKGARFQEQSKCMSQAPSNMQAPAAWTDGLPVISLVSSGLLLEHVYQTGRGRLIILTYVSKKGKVKLLGHADSIKPTYI